MKLSQVVNKGNPRWRVSAYIRGQRRQRFFKSRRKARLWIKSLEADEGCDGFWGQRTNQEQLEIMEAFSASRKQGFSLLKAVSVYEGKGRKWPTSVRAAVSTYLTSIENHSYRPTSMKQIQCNLNQLVAELDCTPCQEVTSTMMEEWFAKRNWKRSTIDGVIAKVGPFFTWCVREGYCEGNPCKAVKRPRADQDPPRIFTPQEAKKLLQAAFRTDEDLVPFLAIGLFAGIRPMEIQRLTWEDISGQYIEVSAGKSKTRQRRLVEVLPNLSSWLELVGELPARNKRKRLTALVAKCGLEWHQDIMRHSFASYHLAMFRSAEKTALELGHRDSTMLFRHYRELVTKPEAEAYWEIRPSSRNT